jgi:hypothetical protein
MAAIAADPIVQDWWKLTDAMQEPLPDRQPGSWWTTIPRSSTPIDPRLGGASEPDDGPRTGGFIQRGDRASLADGVGPAEARLRLAADRGGQVLELVWYGLPGSSRISSSSR